MRGRSTQAPATRVGMCASIMLVAAFLGLGGSSAGAQPSPCNGSPPCENWMSASWAGPAPVGTTVDVYVSVDWATTSYQGFDTIIEYDGSVALFSSVEWQWGDPCLIPEGCWYDDDVGGGLRQTSGGGGRSAGPVLQTGAVAWLKYQCVGEGVTVLRLVPPPSPHGTTTLAPGGITIPTGLVGGYIVCEAPPPTETPTPTPTATSTPTATATATATPTPCPDSDGDGCDDCSEQSMGLDPLAWYDFYDVPVPAQADMTPNGPRNQLVDTADVLGVLFYVFADDEGPPNTNGVDYDSVKGSCDWNGDTTADEEGRCYDRTPGAEPSPPFEAGPPNGVIDIGDVLAALVQAFVIDCSNP